MSRNEAEALGPEAIRALRGERSRAAFARQLGVTPLTVYRWELPEAAAQARRPRGRVMEALRQLAEGGQPAVPPPLRPSLSVLRQDLSREERARLSPCLTLLQRADWRAAEDALLGLLTSGALRSTGARALAAAGLAYVYRWGFEDARRAFTVLLPHLDEAESGTLPEAAAAHVHAMAANLFASPDGRIFDAGKVNVHVARAEALLGPHVFSSGEVRCHLRVAELAAAFYLGTPELIIRQYGRLEEALTGVADPTLRLLASDAIAHETAFRGEASLATRRFRETAQAAARMGYAFLEARNLGFLAQRRLDEACEPGEALALMRRAREVAWSGRIPRGISFVYAARAEADALMRLGRFPEAEAVLDQGEVVTEELRWTPHHLVGQRIRLLYLTGRYADIRELAARLSRYEGPIQQSLTRVYGCFAQALADWAEGHVQRAAEGYATAHARVLEVGGWPYLRRDCLIGEVGTRAAAYQLPEARAALRRARSMLEQFPSAWHTALLHRQEGLLLVREGHWREAREKLEASLATFTLAGDQPEAALTRRTLALTARALGEAGTEAVLAQCEEELRRYGITPPMDFSADLPPAQEAPSPEAAPRLGAESLVVPFERLAVRGMGAPLIQRELVAVLEGLFPGRAARLEELDSQGRATPLLGGEPGVPASEWVEFGDGCGRRLRVGVAGPLPADGRALLQALARLAGFALEVAVLRGFAQAEPPLREPESTPEVPGFIAASPAMRKLKTELAGLSGSRATVIVTGESGSGKEVVARALHQLSARAERPYVAFNCAAVPRELFEGQLFGHRRGAYTGAATDHPGVIRTAHGGTLFLDEIGELPLEVQPKLLRFLENGEIFPLGETRPAQVDVRVIAATHRDLGQLVREGRFREDLYYRLQVVPVHVPPLRERREDIIALARHFVNQLSPEGKEPPQLGPDALAALVAHPWPGNVRELRNVIERSLAFGSLPAVLGADRLRIAG
ncbi:sigma-54-dependent transcriptional regulator [Archangium gephyra]|uniref:Response regulator of zinc sigma-54-dependent two-component system n=1 Tax=Archangium gephyra TaxID=48 RepID=A0AAC8Q2M4_9BACT|nr:sigma-54 dependent transcriptional regulator [Archangium gephyra]AKI99919.1 Response regulator of zinc sigma-54-dependent two-component system [Archangium gephyra]